MSLLGRLRTGPRLSAAFLTVFALSGLATAVGLVGLGEQHDAAVEADHLRVLVEEMDRSTYYTSDIGAWESGVAHDAYYLGPAQAIAPDSANRAGLLASVSAAEEYLASVHTGWMTPAERADFEVLQEKWRGYLATAVHRLTAVPAVLDPQGRGREAAWTDRPAASTPPAALPGTAGGSRPCPDRRPTRSALCGARSSPVSAPRRCRCTGSRQLTGARGWASVGCRL